MSPLEAIHAHRRAQSAEGWPILNALPNTFVVKRLLYLESLSAKDVAALLDDWEAYDCAVADAGNAAQDARATIHAYPAFAAYVAAAQPTGDVRGASTLSVKLVAKVLEDPGLSTLQDWAAFLALPPGGERLRPPLARSQDDLVPVPPRKIRAGLKAMMARRFGAESLRIGADHTRFEGSFDGHAVTLDALFAAGWSKATRQVDPHLSVAAPDGANGLSGGYEALWSIPAQWDYLTEENWDRSLTLLGDLAVLLVRLVQGRMPDPFEMPRA